MKFFITLLSALLLVFGAQPTQAETNHSNLNPFKKKGVGNKVAIEAFHAAVQDAINGNHAKWQSLVTVSFEDYSVLVRDNVTSGYKAVTKGEAQYMLLHSKLVTRHIAQGEKIWGVAKDGSLDYYTIDHDFDGAVLVYEYTDNSGNLIQIELCLWECFNPKQVRYQIAPPTVLPQNTHDTVVVYKEIVKEVVLQQPVYYTRQGFDWTVLLQLPVWRPGYYCVPMNYCQPIFGCQPQYRCVSGGRECGLYPVNNQTTTIVNNYITVNNITNVNNNVINVINPTPQVPRPAPTYTNTGGGGIVTDNTGGGGMNPTGGTGTNTGGGGYNYGNTGGSGKRDWDNVPYQTARPQGTYTTSNATGYGYNKPPQQVTQQPRQIQTVGTTGTTNTGDYYSQPRTYQQPRTTYQQQPTQQVVQQPRGYTGNYGGSNVTTTQQQPRNYGTVQQMPVQNFQQPRGFTQGGGGGSHSVVQMPRR